MRNALEMGIDVLQHAGSAGTAPPYSQQLITDIVNAGRPVVITAAHRAWVYPDTGGVSRAAAGSAARRRTSRPAIYAEVQDSLKNWRALGYFQRTDREMFFRERGVKQFIESGAVIGMGTDSGTPMNFHTEALWREAKVHVDMGMPPIKVISALTRVGANILGKQRDLGTIEPGKLADIIVVNGNPLYDITALSHVEIGGEGRRGLQGRGAGGPGNREQQQRKTPRNLEREEPPMPSASRSRLTCARRRRCVVVVGAAAGRAARPGSAATPARRPAAARACGRRCRASTAW